MIGYVKIEKCSRYKSWYEDLVGQWYPVYADEGIEWETYQLDGYKNYILKQDCNFSLPEYNSVMEIKETKNVVNGKTSKEQ